MALSPGWGLAPYRERKETGEPSLRASKCEASPAPTCHRISLCKASALELMDTLGPGVQEQEPRFAHMHAHTHVHRQGTHLCVCMNGITHMYMCAHT